MIYYEWPLDGMVVVATIPSDDVTPLTPSGEHQFNVILLWIRHGCCLLLKVAGGGKSKYVGTWN